MIHNQPMTSYYTFEKMKFYIVFKKQNEEIIYDQFINAMDIIWHGTISYFEDKNHRKLGMIYDKPT